MEEQVIQALLQCMSGESNTRIAAESYIASLKLQSGFHTLLLQLSQRPDLPEQLTQISAIILKNSLSEWKKSTVAIEDKTFIRASILTCLKKSVPSKVRTQLEEIAQGLCKAEYPWDGINEQIDGFIESHDPDCVFAALTMISKIAKNYEFVMGEKRQKLFTLATFFFGKLEKLLESLLKENIEVSYEYSAIILQIFWLSFYIELPEALITEAMLDSWITKFVFLLSIPLDTSESLNETSPIMQCKKLSTQILYRFFSRYNSPENLIGKTKLIAEVFTSKWSALVLGQVVQQVFCYKSRALPELLMNSSLKYINEAVKHKGTFEILKTQCLPDGNLVISGLITEMITMVLCKTQKDEEVWQDNPIEYIRKEADIGRAYYSAATAALDLLETLCKSGYLQQFFTYVSSALTNPNLLQKEALLNEIGSISSVLVGHSELLPTIENMLFIHVFPELNSQVGFLRARAAWVYSKFASITFVQPEHQKLVLEKACALLLDKDLPVKYEAALTIPKLLKWEASKQRVRGEISNLLQVYLKLINEIDSEEIVEALEEIVENFDKEILPYAVELIGQLVVAFSNLASREIADDNGDSAMVAVSTLNTISRLIDAISESPEDIIKASQSLSPVLLHCLSRKGCEYMEEALSILSSLLNCSPSGSLTHLYPLMFTVLESVFSSDPYGIEKTEGIFPIIGNFIKKYTAQFKQDLTTVLNIALQLVKGHKRVQVLGFKILMSIIEYLREDMVQVLSGLITEILPVFNTQVSNKLKAAACQFLFVCIWADLNATLAVIGPLGVLKSVLEFCFGQLKLFEDRLPRTRLLVGLSVLLPSVVSERELASAVLNNILKLFVLAEEDSEDSVDEENVDSKEFDDKCQELYKRIKENLEDSEEEAPALENDADQDYDSIFEDMNYKAVFLEKAQICGLETLRILVTELEFESKVVFQRLFPELWNAVS